MNQEPTTTTTVTYTAPDWYYGGKIIEPLFCEYFLKTYGVFAVGSTFYTTEGRVEDESSLRAQICNEISCFVTRGLAERVNHLLEAIRVFCYIPEIELQTDRIHLANGTYYLEPPMMTQQRKLCYNRLPAMWVGGAKEPEAWLRFLGELLEPEDIPTLQEFIGYLLIPCTKAQKMLIIIGRGGEGKSRIGVVLKKLLGSAMVNGSISKLETNRFAPADLEHRLVMVDDDLKLEALPQTNVLKTIITADTPLDLERKGKQSHQGILYARIIGFGNGTLQALYDQTDAFYRRQIILKAKDRPADRVDDPFLGEKLCEESDGILQWAVEGLLRLRANNYRFTESAAARSNLEDSRRQSCNVLDFMESTGYIRLDPTAAAATRDLYVAYQAWCRDNAAEAMGVQGFSTYLSANQGRWGIQRMKNIRAHSGKRVRGFMGIESEYVTL